MKIFFACCIVIGLFTINYAQDLATSLITKDICPDKNGLLKCEPTINTNYTPFVVEALFGISTIESDLCEYTDGDCYSLSTSKYCSNTDPECTVYGSTSQRVPNCGNQRADYLHIRYRCVPAFSKIIKDNKICDSSSDDITELNGFISSPNFPVYTIQPNECIRKIKVPDNKVINIWTFNDFKIPGSDDDCKEDYLKITDSTGTYTTCGYRKFTFEKQFCSSVLYLQYKAPADLSSIYSGFKLYFEALDRSTQPSCSTATPVQPTPPTTQSTVLPPISDLTASDFKKDIICKGQEKTISIPARYSLFVFNYYYGVTSDSTCNTINPQNCKSPAPFTCTTQGSCKISLTSDISLNDCDGKTANYIGIEYKFVPLTTSTNFSICDNTDLNATLTTNGIITSSNYPLWQSNQNCNRSIIAKHGRIIRAYITDLSIEPPNNNNECLNGYLRFVSECGETKYCGDRSSGGSFLFETCSNTLQIYYVSSSNADPGYRGFNLYFEATTDDKASVQITKSACTGSYFDLECPKGTNTDFTVFLTQLLYAIKPGPSANNTCQYSEGDCYEESDDTYCYSAADNSCYVYTYSNENLPNCNNAIANYVILNYRCIPAFSKKINNYDICDKTLKAITDSYGFISSPNYPTYTIVNQECTQKIEAPKDKVIRLWIASDMKFSNWNDDCVDDYIQITDNTGSYRVCGYEKYTFENKLCSSVIYISYSAPADLSSFYTGFRIYYEFVDRSTQPDCPTNTPGSPAPPVITTTSRPGVDDLVASDFSQILVCRGESKTINIPNSYNLFPTDVYYGATASQQCVVSSNDCKSPALIDCSLTGSCTISLLSDVYLMFCSNKLANYYVVEYRFIPYVTQKNYTICSDTDLNLKKGAYGIITNDNYPNWASNQNCIRKIFVPTGFIIRTYVNDFNLEDRNTTNGQCENSYLKLESDNGERIYCGSRAKFGNYVFESGTNAITISYKTSSNNNGQYRGFNLYFEVVSSSVNQLITLDTCAGEDEYLECNPSPKTNYTVFISEAFYGIKSSPSVEGCVYTPGDCYDPQTTTYCSAVRDYCYLFTYSSTTVKNCGNKKADFFHARYRCVPSSSSVFASYNICNNTVLNTITDTAAFIRSPNYPLYTTVPNDCTVKIQAPTNKVIRIWAAVDMKYADSNDQCVNDYLMITDSIETYKVCGYQKISLDRQLCSSVIYVTYRAPSELSSTFYDGFQIYYEFMDRAFASDCPTNTPMSPTTPQPVTVSTTTKPLAANTASAIYKLNVCKGSQKDIYIPSGYSLSLINAYYGTTPDYTCNTINPQNCKAPTQITCSSQGVCTISLYSDIPIDNCGGLIAHYIGVEYRFIPIISTSNFSICTNTDIDGNINKGGIIVSNNYPNFLVNQNCVRKIIAPAGKFVRVYINDLSIEQYTNGTCENGFLKFSSPSCNEFKYCGSKQSSSVGYSYESCSESLTIEYKSSSNSDQSYRGFNLYFEITSADKITSQKQENICRGTTKTIKCEPTPLTDYTVIVNEAIHGVKQYSTNNCELTAGDCYETLKELYCKSPSDTCSIYASYFEYVVRCDDKMSDYVNVKYRCIPYDSSIIKQYNICDKSLNEITDESGMIYSPNYPTFSSVKDECIQKIVVPDDKIINIWITNIDIKDPESNNDCVTDYLKITHNTGTFKACGYRKYSFENRLCSSVVYISYKAPTISGFYDGFKLYYETVPRSSQPNCPTGTPTPPFNVNVTTIKPEILDLQATNIEKLYVCYGEMKVLNKKLNYVLFPLDFYYGITQDGTCQSFSDKDCKAPAPFSCASDDDCQISLYNQVNVDDCSGNVASYIGMEYRYIPFYSSKNYSICSNNTESIIIDGSLLKYGVITSPYYPKWIPNERCRLRIDAPLDKLIRVYITDLSTEPEDEDSGNCTKSYLSLNTGYINTRYCGDKSNEIGNYVFISCSNSLDIVYHSSSIASSSYRGFNLYYEVIDKTNNNIQCPNISTSTRSTRTTRHVTLINDNQKHSSNKLIGWSLGIGIPVIIIIIILFFMLLKRTSTQNGNLAFNFQKMHNSDLE